MAGKYANDYDVPENNGNTGTKLKQVGTQHSLLSLCFWQHITCIFYLHLGSSWRCYLWTVLESDYLLTQVGARATSESS